MLISLTSLNDMLRVSLRADGVVFVSEHRGKTAIIYRIGERHETIYVEEGFDSVVALIDEALEHVGEH